MSKVKFTVIFAAGAVAGAFGMYALNVALARDGGALGGEALVIPLVCPASVGRVLSGPRQGDGSGTAGPADR